MTDHYADEIFEEQGREIARLTGRWPGEIRDIEKAVTKAKRTLSELVTLYDIELVEGPDADDATADLVEIGHRLRNLGRIAKIRLQTEKDWQASVAKQEAARKDGECACTPGGERCEWHQQHPEDLTGTPFPDRPGYMTGRCGHAVAGSEWKAGFRVCERCPADAEFYADAESGKDGGH